MSIDSTGHNIIFNAINLTCLSQCEDYIDPGLIQKAMESYDNIHFSDNEPNIIYLRGPFSNIYKINISTDELVWKYEWRDLLDDIFLPVGNSRDDFLSFYTTIDNTVESEVYSIWRMDKSNNYIFYFNKKLSCVDLNNKELKWTYPNKTDYNFNDIDINDGVYNQYVYKIIGDYIYAIYNDNPLNKKILQKINIHTGLLESSIDITGYVNLSDEQDVKGFLYNKNENKLIVLFKSNVRVNYITIDLNLTSSSVNNYSYNLNTTSNYYLYKINDNIDINNYLIYYNVTEDKFASFNYETETMNFLELINMDEINYIDKYNKFIYITYDNYTKVNKYDFNFNLIESNISIDYKIAQHEDYWKKYLKNVKIKRTICSDDTDRHFIFYDNELNLLDSYNRSLLDPYTISPNEDNNTFYITNKDELNTIYTVNVNDYITIENIMIKKSTISFDSIIDNTYTFEWETTYGDLHHYEVELDNSGNWININEQPFYTWNNISKGNHVIKVKAVNVNNDNSNIIQWNFTRLDINNNIHGHIYNVDNPSEYTLTDSNYVFGIDQSWEISHCGVGWTVNTTNDTVQYLLSNTLIPSDIKNTYGLNIYLSMVTANTFNLNFNFNQPYNTFNVKNYIHYSIIDVDENKTYEYYSEFDKDNQRLIKEHIKLLEPFHTYKVYIYGLPIQSTQTPNYNDMYWVKTPEFKFPYYFGNIDVKMLHSNIEITDMTSDYIMNGMGYRQYYSYNEETEPSFDINKQYTLIADNYSSGIKANILLSDTRFLSELDGNVFTSNSGEFRIGQVLKDGIQITNGISEPFLLSTPYNYIDDAYNNQYIKNEPENFKIKVSCIINRNDIANTKYYRIDQMPSEAVRTISFVGKKFKPLPKTEKYILYSETITDSLGNDIQYTPKYKADITSSVATIDTGNYSNIYKFIYKDEDQTNQQFELILNNSTLSKNLFNVTFDFKQISNTIEPKTGEDNFYIQDIFIKDYECISDIGDVLTKYPIDESSNYNFKVDFKPERIPNTEFDVSGTTYENYKVDFTLVITDVFNETKVYDLCVIHSFPVSS